MALTSHDTPAERRRKVTSPNGTTQAAIEVMDDKQMHQIIADAMIACEQRSRELSQAFGKSLHLVPTLATTADFN